MTEPWANASRRNVFAGAVGLIVAAGLSSVTALRASEKDRQHMTTELKRFTGVRVVVTTTTLFDEVLEKLTGLLGHAPLEQLGALVRASSNREVFEREVQRHFVGESGFMKFGEFDHGSWLGLYGIHRRTVRWIFGNPVIAVTMIKYDITAGLFAPVEMLITEAEDGVGTTLTYLLPSSLMVIDDNPPLRAAAEELDKKVAALVERVTR